MKYSCMNPKFSLSQVEMFEIHLVKSISLQPPAACPCGGQVADGLTRRISNIIALDSENFRLICGISVKYTSSTLVPVSFTLKSL